MPPVGLRVRVRTSPSLRRALPRRLVERRALRRGAEIWERSADEREDAIAAMDAVVGATSRAGEIDRLAREALIERRVETALFWHPWSQTRMEPRAEAQMRAAFAAGRGVLVSSCHVGPHFRATSAIASVGRVPYSVSGPWFFEPPSHDEWGRRLARWRKGVPSVPVLSRGSFATLVALLEEGQVVYICFDQPGRRETRFLGKTVLLVDGTARLAVAADALILPVRARRVGHHAWLDVAAPLDPREHAAVEELHEALAAVHEHWIMEDPAKLEDPRVSGWAGSTEPIPVRGRP